jgi:hypothetical protein
MTDANSLANELTLEVVYHDEHLIELRCQIAFDGWSGIAQACTTQGELQGFADMVKQFGENPKSPAELEAGADNGIGLIGLRFYVLNRSGHIRCHVQLASGNVNTPCRPEEIWRFAAEVPTESGLIVAFAKQLTSVAKTLKGTAILTLVAP